MKRTESPKNNSVNNAIMVLEYLASIDFPQDLAVISKALGMNKSNVYRLLSTLKEKNYVFQDENSKQYSLGAKVTWLAAKYLDKNEVRKVAHPLIETLSQQVGETIHLGILDGWEVMYVDKINGKAAVHMVSQVGGRMPIHCTSLGKALLAFQPESKWHEYIDQCGLPARTSHTITDPALFYEELRKIRKQRFSFDDMENEEGIRCIAAPIFDASGNPVAAVSISSWIIAMTTERVQTFVTPLLETTDAISARLGSISHTHSDNAVRANQNLHS